jgi:hypothetical protein
MSECQCKANTSTQQTKHNCKAEVLEPGHQLHQASNAYYLYSIYLFTAYIKTLYVGQIVERLDG